MLHTTCLRALTLSSLLLAPVALLPAQAPPAAAAASPARQLGTVQSIEGTTLTLVTAAGTPVTVPVDPAAKILQLPPGSVDLRAATPGVFVDIVVGDRVVTGKPGDTATATRVILMKSSDISARNQAQQADWQRRGFGGLVKAVDGPTISITAGPRLVKIDTTSATLFRRYAPDSVKFQDARPGTLADVHPGDQLTVRGEKSDDGAEIKAEEVVTGTFSNLSGAVATVDASAGTLTLKDLTSKRSVTVKVTPNSDLRKLPPQAAAAFAARSIPGPSSNPSAPATAAPGAAAAPGARARAGMDLSRMLAGLPAEPLAELKPGDAVMIVASATGDASAYTAITLLAGVEPLLTATAKGGQPLTLSPWSIGGGAPEGGPGGGPQ